MRLNHLTIILFGATLLTVTVGCKSDEEEAVEQAQDRAESLARAQGVDPATLEALKRQGVAPGSNLSPAMLESLRRRAGSGAGLPSGVDPAALRRVVEAGRAPTPKAAGGGAAAKGDPAACRKLMTCCQDVAAKLPQAKTTCQQLDRALGQMRSMGPAFMDKQCVQMRDDLDLDDMAEVVPGGLPASCKP